MKKIFFSALIALAFVACQKSDIDTPETSATAQEITLTAYIDGATRLSIQETNSNTIKLAWSNGDKIVAHYTDGTNTYSDEFSYIGDNQFVGTLSATPANGVFTKVTYHADANFTQQNGWLSDEFIWMETASDVAVGSTLQFSHKTAILMPDFSSLGLEFIPNGAEVTITGVHTDSGLLTFTAGSTFRYIHLPMGDKSFAPYSTLSFTVRVSNGGDTTTYQGSTTPSSKQIVAGYLYTPPVVPNSFITYTATGKVSPQQLTISYDSQGSSYSSPNGIIKVNGILKEVKSNSFKDKSALTSMTLPHSVTTIGSYAFLNCTNLQSINFPQSLTVISESAFYGCTKLTSIDIPNGITTIYKNSFQNCSALVNVNLPTNLTTIGNFAFYNCTNLQNIDFPESLTEIGNSAFYGCNALESIDLPEGLITIAGSAFQNCRKEKNIVIPSTVTSIGSYAFSSSTTNDSSDVITITVKAVNPPTLQVYAFQNRNITAIYVPEESVSLYKEAANWKTYKDKIYPIQ